MIVDGIPRGPRVWLKGVNSGIVIYRSFDSTKYEESSKSPYNAMLTLMLCRVSMNDLQFCCHVVLNQQVGR